LKTLRFAQGDGLFSSQNILFFPCVPCALCEKKRNLPKALAPGQRLGHGSQSQGNIQNAPDGTHWLNILQHMPVMLIAFDESGKLVVWNRECERITGYPAAELVDNPQALTRLIPDEAQREGFVRK
jgi:PAS domain-containing protein